MKYLVESIGAEFSKKDTKKLSELFTERAKEGYQFHSVFQVSQPGCLGFGSPKITYLAVYEKKDES